MPHSLNVVVSRKYYNKQMDKNFNFIRTYFIPFLDCFLISNMFQMLGINLSSDRMANYKSGTFRTFFTDIDIPTYDK